MPIEAQMAAFGKVLVQPSRRSSRGETSLTVLEGGGQAKTALDTLSGDGSSKEDKAICLKWFDIYLHGQGLRQKTIDEHLSNVDFYLNTYLTRMGHASVGEGIGLVHGFLGDFFIRECMWSTKTSIKRNAVSIKKFYQCMAWRGIVTQSQYRELSAQIKEELPEWIAELDAWERGDSFFDDDECD